MADDGPDQKRKTVSLSYAQAWGGSGIIAALLALQPLKSYVFTRDEATLQLASQNEKIVDLKVAQEKGFSDLKQFIVACNEESVRRLERSNDKIVDRIREGEARTDKRIDAHEHRLDLVEAAHGGSRKSFNN